MRDWSLWWVFIVVNKENINELLFVIPKYLGLLNAEEEDNVFNLTFGYTEELKKSPEEKIKVLGYQKYYTGGAIILMFIVLICMYLILN